MKKDQSLTTFNDSILSCNLNNNKLQILCSSNRLSSHLCTDINCHKQAFVCQNEQCQCQIQHEKCLIMKIKSVYRKLTQKIVSSQSVQNMINATYDKIIDEISNLRDKLLVQIKQRVQEYRLTQNQKQLLLVLNEGKKSNITGHKVWQVINNFNNLQKDQQQINLLLAQILKPFNQYKDAISICNNYLNKQIHQISLFNNNIDNKLNQNKINQSNQYNLFAQSDIVSQIQQINTIKSFFQQNTIINKTQLIYKASKNQFDTNQFHQKCDNISNTITLCQTQFNKKIGAFTPLQWESLQISPHKKDQLNKSFIFSITQKDKFILQQKSKAIYTSVKNGPGFGGGGIGCDFLIRNKANNNKESFANINTAYQNVKYKNGDKQSFERFCGNKDSMYFQVKQWQVWRVEFE